MTLGNEDKNPRQEMGYHGGNMHGYSLSKKEDKLRPYAGNGTVEPEKQGEKINELG
ncbi:hypothetical protein [Brevibacillus fulvus]|uniref:Uncharacterized protein n=1 Tax=Brevibacillus fulvus TaxID=1125967 RepID=A0A938XWI9_9BACL|nr:hypothetical protein [Brevibacillus fulvus]MBM7589419.1 hypothetical protein [Brevibacillus fulvus]